MGWIRGGMIQGLLVALAAAGFLIGVMLIYLGRRGRRIDDHPLCRKCGYDLTGRAEGSGRCAECGADLSRPRAVRVGNRMRRPGPFWAGVSITILFLILAGGIGWVQMSSANLMKYKPVWLLRSDASSLLSNKRVPAVTELTRRFTAGELTEAHIHAIISDALVFQANPNFPWKEWDGLMNAILLAGKVEDADWVTFVKQAVRLKLQARPLVRAGDPMPVKLSLTTERLSWEVPSMSMRHTPILKMEWLTAQISGVKVTPPPYRQAQFPTMLFTATIDGLEVDGAQTASLAPGVHRLRGEVMVTPLSLKSQENLTRFNLAVETEVTILPANTDPKQLLISNPSLQNGMQIAIWNVKVTGRGRGPVTNIYTLQLEVSGSPAGFAHRAFLRTKDGSEFPMGSVTFPHRYSGGVNLTASADVGQAGTVDVILRPDFDLVKDSPRNDAIWGEEIIFPDIKVMPPGTPMRGGGRRPSTTTRPGG